MQVTSFKGINNQLKANQLPPDELASCVNFSIDDSGSLRTRNGLRSISTSPSHSLFAFNGKLYFRSGTKLNRLNQGVETIDSSLGNGSTCYAASQDALFYSDGVKCRKFDGNESASWGIAPPIFDVAESGDYQIAVTYLRGAMESGAHTPKPCGAVATVTIPDSADASHKAIYMSTQGGEVLRRVAVIPNGQTTATVTSSGIGPELMTLHKTPPPPHQISLIRNGRAIVGVDDFILYSDPFMLDVFDPLRQSIRFDGRITMLAGVSPDVLIVGTSNGVFRVGGADIGSSSIAKISDYGVTLGAYAIIEVSNFSSSQGLAVVFASPNGFCLVGQDGSVSVITGDRYRIGSRHSGSACESSVPGSRSVVFSLRQ